MPLHFVDREGGDGWIGDDLSVSYGGPEDVALQVESCVDGRECDGRANEEVLQKLMLDLSTHESIWQVERVDESEDVGQEGSF